MFKSSFPVCSSSATKLLEDTFATGPVDWPLGSFQSSVLSLSDGARKILKMIQVTSVACCQLVAHIHGTRLARQISTYIQSCSREYTSI